MEGLWGSRSASKDSRGTPSALPRRRSRFLRRRVSGSALDALMADLARLDRPPPVLVISGGGLKLSPEFVLTASRALGASEVLHKPFSMAELLGAVTALLAPK